jgi:uncharacterized protein (DUF1800 family)
MSARQDMAAAVAAHRFGLGEARLAAIGSDARGWLVQQIGAADAQRGEQLASGITGVKRYAEFLRDRRQAASTMAAEPSMAADMAAGTPRETRNIEAQFGEHFRQIVQADVRARLLTAATTQRPFAERLALFWANHFTVSMAKASARGVVGAFEREAIRPHIAGNFETLLKAAVHHPGMLRYLDNDASAGPDSPFVLRQRRRSERSNTPMGRVSGLNENLAREILELHTLGVSGGGAAYGGWGGYSQTDVTEFARVLTGWRVPIAEILRFGDDAPAARFDPAWHQPGAKTVLGKRYPEGPDALDAVLHALALHPSTARFIATKLARHFSADEPPPALVARLEAAYRGSGGDLPTVYRALIDAPEAWAPLPAKLKSPEEFVVSSARLLQLGEQLVARAPDAGISQLGQRVQSAPSPAGWPDKAEEWLGPDAVWKRVEWATRVARLVGRTVDARQLAAASLGERLMPDTALQIERAADGPQALALLMLAPEFQRR